MAEVAILSSDQQAGWCTRLFAKFGLDLRLFYIAVPRAKGDLIGEPAHLVAAIVAIVCEAISTASASVGINILVLATLLRALALLPSWKQMLGQTWIKLLLIWIAWMALSIAWSPDMPRGFDRLGHLKFFIWIPMLWPLYKQWRWLFAAFLLSAFVVQCIQLAGAFGATHQMQTLQAGMRHPTMVGLWNAMALSCWLFLAVSVGWQAMALCIPVAVFSAVGFVWAGQRAALWGILIEIVIANIVLVFAVRGWMRRTCLRVVLGLIVIGGVYFFIGEKLTGKVMQLYNETTQSLTSGTKAVKGSPEYKVTFECRIAMWEMSMIAWRKHPIIGVGYGGYQIATDPIKDVVYPAIDIHGFETPHSTYVMILTENGIVGLALYLGFAAAFFVRAFRVVQVHPIRIGVFGGAVIWFAAAAADTYHMRGVFLSIGVIMMALAAMPVDSSAESVDTAH